MSKVTTVDISTLQHVEGLGSWDFATGNLVTSCDDDKARGLVVKVDVKTYSVDVLWSVTPRIGDLYQNMAKQIQIEIDREIIEKLMGR